MKPQEPQDPLRDRAPKIRPINHLDAGRAALGRGDWQAARRAFEMSLQAQEDPEALEGLGLAAWWLDLSDLVRRELFMGMGTKLDRTSGMSLGIGGFALMPANANHFAYTKSETTILPYGQDPVEFKYVNPGDDPRTKTSARRN